MDVLVVGLDCSLDGDPVECPLCVCKLRVGEQPGFMQATGVNPRCETVVRKQLGVFCTQEVPDRRSDVGVHASGPERHATLTCFRAATSSVSSAVIPMKPSAASCGKVSPMPYEASDSEYSACSERRPVTTAAPAWSDNLTSPVTS